MPAALLGVQNFVSLRDVNISSSNQTHQRRHTDLKPLPSIAVQQVSEAMKNDFHSKDLWKIEHKGHRGYGYGCSGRGPVASLVCGVDVAGGILDRVR